MKRLFLLSFVVLLAGCDRQDVNPFVVVSESIPVSKEHFGTQALQQYIPEGTQHQVPAVGFEASDGSFHPILALCNPVPRAGSVEPIRLSKRQLKVFRGVDPIAKNNELLGVYEIDSDVSALQIGFSITRDGQLHLSVADQKSGAYHMVRRVTAVAATQVPKPGM